mgnify:FL=1
MAQQQQTGSGDTRPAKPKRGGSNAVLYGTILVIAVLVFSFLFFGQWGWEFGARDAGEDAAAPAPAGDGTERGGP